MARVRFEARLVAAGLRGDIREIHGRYTGDTREIYGRYRGAPRRGRLAWPTRAGVDVYQRRAAVGRPGVEHLAHAICRGDMGRYGEIWGDIWRYMEI